MLLPISGAKGRGRKNTCAAGLGQLPSSLSTPVSLRLPSVVAQDAARIAELEETEREERARHSLR